MASTFSPILKLELIGNGDQPGTWGTTTNTNLGTLIEQAIAGTASINVTGGNVTLTDLNGVSDEARCAAILVSGTPGVSRNIIAPEASKLYVVSNGSDAAVVIKTASSTGYSIDAGSTVLVYFNGSDFVLVGRSSSSSNIGNTLVLRDASGNFAAGTITGTFSGTIASATVATTQAPGDSSTKVATTAFVDNVAGSLGTMSSQDANSVAITGGTISGVAISTSTVGGLTVGSNATGNRTISTSAPSGGSNGDIWYRY